MTKKELKWRLSELPSGEDVAELVKQKVITTTEARQILFNEEKPATAKVKELAEEVKFLRELCDKLAAKSNGWTTIIREVKEYTPRYPGWFSGYVNVTHAGPQTIPAVYRVNTVNGATSSTIAATSTTGSSLKLLSGLN